ncbi:outer membrane beta-barrel protein [Persicobacter diffluens]|uniref:Outer membrane protein beta-barrel domain-containing protein n=1 Tax=Persicobacter diffluens TaxID=981 RepID=A0AAN5AK68_9BACT|nr:hypothetical protein PEDI_06980 [Persicobacter diffluens]
MYSTNLWHKLHLYRYQIIFVLAFFLPLSTVLAQAGPKINLPYVDQKKIHYGFFVSTGLSGFKQTYSQAYFDRIGFDPNNNPVDLDGVLSIQTERQLSLGVGFIGNLKLAEALDVRVTPKAGFYTYRLTYQFSDSVSIGPPGNGDFRAEQDNIENVRFEMPILLKLKSQRRGNIRAYFIGGINPSVEVTGRREKEIAFEMAGFDLALEWGFGFDLYYPLFRFSPEIRFSHGLMNMKGTNANRPIAVAVDRLTTNSVTLYFNFQ